MVLNDFRRKKTNFAINNSIESDYCCMMEVQVIIFFYVIGPRQMTRQSEGYFQREIIGN